VAAKLTLHEVNLEKHKELKSVLASNNAEKIFREFQIVIGRGNIDTPGALLFIDEIQAIPEALEALRYITEGAPGLPIIAAGSLLEFSLSDHEYSMPVGRVEYMFMGPLVFEEFLIAAGETVLFDYLKNFRMSDGVFSAVAHDRLLDYYRLFLLIGGMPEAADVYLSTKDLTAMRKVQGSIVTTYRDDFAKYAKGAELLRLQKMLDHVSVSIGEKIKYSNVDPDAKSTDIKRALFLLHKAQVVELAYHASGGAAPLRAQSKFNIFKPYYLDCGLISYMHGDISLKLTSPRLIDGKLAEQFIAQHLLALGDPMTRPELYYWLREAKQSNAEVDFLIALRGDIFPVEVKSGTAGVLKSLHQFMASKDSRLAIRFSQNIPDLSEVTYRLTNRSDHRSDSGTFKLLSLPFYMVGQLERVVGEVLA